MTKNAPTIDPITGLPADGSGGDDSVTIKKTEWDDVKRRLDNFELAASRPAPAAPAAPAVPQGPTLAEQLGELDKQIDTFDDQIDKAVAEGKPVSKLMKDRDALTHKKTRLQIKHEDLDPAFNAGVSTINQLSAELTRGKMKHYDIVKDDFEAFLSGLDPTQRMNPQTRQAGYEYAVGKNIDKIMDAQKEEILRTASTHQTGEPGASSRQKGGEGGGGGGEGIPSAKEVLPADALAAMNAVGKTPDEYYRGLGYKGWDDFYEKRGKDYFGVPAE